MEKIEDVFCKDELNEDVSLTEGRNLYDEKWDEDVDGYTWWHQRYTVLVTSPRLDLTSSAEKASHSARSFSSCLASSCLGDASADVPKFNRLICQLLLLSASIVSFSKLCIFEVMWCCDSVDSGNASVYISGHCSAQKNAERSGQSQDDFIHLWNDVRYHLRNTSDQRRYGHNMFQDLKSIHHQRNDARPF